MLRRVWRSRSPGERTSFCASVLVVGALAGLAWAGPFYDPLCPTAALPAGVEFVPGDGLIRNEVGSFDPDREVFRARNHAGALTFGPWLQLPAGRYSVTWYGYVHGDSTPRFEVLNDSPPVPLALATAKLAPTAELGPLHEEAFQLSTPTEGIQFATRVSARDDVSIRAIRLKVLACTSE